MAVQIISSRISFKSPVVGQPTYANEACYNGRRVTALINGKEKSFRFTKEELAFDVEEIDIEEAVKQKEANEENAK